MAPDLKPNLMNNKVDYKVNSKLTLIILSVVTFLEGNSRICLSLNLQFNLISVID